MPEHNKVCRTSAAPPQWFYSDYDLNANRSGGASQLRICSSVFDLEETWKVFIAFPSCHRIAVLSLAKCRWNDLFFLSTRFLNFQLQESEQEKKIQYLCWTILIKNRYDLMFGDYGIQDVPPPLRPGGSQPLQALTSNSLLNLSFCYLILFFKCRYVELSDLSF